MTNFSDYSFETLVSMRNKLIDKVSTDYHNELDKDNDSQPSDAVIEVMNDYRDISNEIERRMTNVRKFSNIISSGQTVKGYYDTLNKFTGALENDDWYNVHHDYRMSL